MSCGTLGICHWIGPGVALLGSFLVFVVNDRDRRAIDKELRGRGANVPERMVSYALADIEQFVSALAPGPLERYAETVLKRDMYFAVLLAVAVAWGAVAAILQWPGDWWVLRLFSLSAAFGILYGVADVAEDRLLRQIIRRALPARHNGVFVSTTRRDSGGKESSVLGIDAAQVDAANALTRVKMITLGLSVTGALAFGVMMLVVKAWSGETAGTRGDGQSGGAAKEQPKTSSAA